MVSNEWDLTTWNKALADRFFSPDFEGEPVTFAVDDETLSTISGVPPSKAVELLAIVVRREVMPGYRFRRVRDRARRWQQDGCDGPPPSLPLLALNVLAVTLNEHFGLYQPLRHLLDPNDDSSGMPGDYDDCIPELWEQLRWWLEVEQDGRRGLPTITRHEFFVNVGYSMQQAVLRGYDRPLVYRFFRSIGLAPEAEQIVPTEIRRALAIWSRSRLPRASRLYRLATDTSLAPFAEALLFTMATRWDGRLRNLRTGSRAAVLRLVLRLRPIHLGFVALRREGDPETLTLRDDEGDIMELKSKGSWYEPLPLAIDVTDAVLTHGIELSGDALGFFHEEHRGIPFRYHDELLEWVSADRIIFDEKHHLLVHADIRGATERWLTAERFEGHLDASATPHLPDGWFLIRDIRLDGRPLHEPPSEIRDLIGSSGGGARVRLVGGLKLRGLGYLTGGVPNVALPPELKNRRFQIHTEGFDPIELKVQGHEFSLGGFDLPPGEYEVIQDKASLRFSVVEVIRERPGPDVGSIRAPASCGRSVSGLLAQNALDIAPPIVVPARGGNWFIILGPSPRDHGTVEAPIWFESKAGPLSWVALDAWVDFQPAWLLWPMERDPPKYLAFAIEPVAPKGPGGGTSWGHLITSAHLAPHASIVAQALWVQYTERASELTQ